MRIEKVATTPRTVTAAAAANGRLAQHHSSAHEQKDMADATKPYIKYSNSSSTCDTAPSALSTTRYS
eukprot:6214103-Pleurochrysis_carterae.AAC.1